MEVNGHRVLIRYNDTCHFYVRDLRVRRGCACGLPAGRARALTLYGSPGRCRAATAESAPLQRQRQLHAAVRPRVPVGRLHHRRGALATGWRAPPFVAGAQAATRPLTRFPALAHSRTLLPNPATPPATQRNYRFFLLFIFTATILCLYVMGVCLAQLFLRHQELVDDQRAAGNNVPSSSQ